MHAPSLLILAATALFAIPSLAQTVSIFLQPAPGIVDVDSDGKRPTGPALAFLEQLSSKSSVKFEYVLASTARGLVQTQAQSNTCAAGIFRTPEREDKFAWIGPVTSTRLVVYARADAGFSSITESEMQNLRVGVVRQNSAALWMKEHSIRVLEVSHMAVGFSMLEMGRIDLFASTELVAAGIIKDMPAPKPKVVHVMRNLTTYLACNRSLDEKVSHQLRRAMDELRRIGAMEFLGVRRSSGT